MIMQIISWIKCQRIVNGEGTELFENQRLIKTYVYGGYPIIKQKLSERDLSREWIGMKTLK